MKSPVRASASQPALRPLAMALLSAFPWSASAQSAVVRPVMPAASVVPRPMPGWRVSGTGAALPATRSNAAGGIDQTINQTSTSAVYHWQSFDIGAASSVTFDFPTSASSALNRVTGSSSPSQILGSLRSQYANPDPAGAPLVGGTVYLYNPNGILFGRGAQVNVGSLIASTLNLKDSDYLDNLTASITGKGASFAFDSSVPSLYTDDRNFVLVDPGAAITTASGGRVFLFAKNVQNGGTITAPDGQVALAGGGSVYLQDPTVEKLYASEANANYPVLRGLLVEVGAGPGGNAAGSASNLVGGVIDTARGNTTLVGMAVNQLGRISATTSVSQNGSVFLMARGGAVDGTNGSFDTKRATVGGALTLGAGSTVEIAPDTRLGADGKPVTSDGNSTFTASRVELAGKTIEMRAGATIVAHGGTLNARAEATPDYRDNASPDYTRFNGDDAVRIVLADGAGIDVSGTTDVSVSAARNFVTTQLIGKSDLKDAPLQKDGPLYRSKVTFDLRDPVPILGDTSAYASAIQRDATERLAAGGSVLLSSTGAVVTAAKSTLDVAGGQVDYSAATAVPTRLVAADGTRYTLDQAPKDIVYTAIEGASRPTQDRWGIVPQYLPAQAVTGQVVPGYVDGRAAGTLTVAAPHSILDGQVAAGAVAGVRQTAGLDPMAAAGRIDLGFRSNVNAAATVFAFGDTAFVTAGLRDLAVTAAPQSLPSNFWSNPLGSSVPQTSRIASATVNDSGLGKLTVTADGGIAVEGGADLVLGTGATLDLAAGGAAGLSIGAGVRSEGGTVLARTRDLGSQALAGTTRAGAVTLQAGASIDVSGDWVNRALDGAEAAAATAGGTVTLSSARALLLQDASRIDVSGGATVATSGIVAGTTAGSIALESDQKRTATDAPSPVHLGAQLRGLSVSGGGTLALHGMDSVTIASQALPRGVKDGPTPGSLQLSPQFFETGSFTNYDVQAVSRLQVLNDIDLILQARNAIVTPAASVAPSGSRLAEVLAPGTAIESQRRPASLSLGAVTPVGSHAAGDLSVGAGARIAADPLASVTLRAGLHLDLEGRIEAPGGKVALALVDGAGVNQGDTPATGSLTVGAAAAIDVSGTTVRKPQTGPLPQGTVVGGGSVDLAVGGVNARLSPLVVERGAVIDADGASDLLGVAVVTASGSTALQQRAVASAGGSVAIVAREGGALLAGDIHAAGGGEGTSAGSFSLSLSGVRTSSASGNPVNLVGNYVIGLQQAPITQTTPAQGSVLLSATALGAGFANVALHSQDRIRFNGDVALGLAGDLTLDAPLVSAAPQSRKVSLAAGGELALGNTPTGDLPTAATGVAGSTVLSLQGGLVEFAGLQGLQGFQRIDATAGSEIRLAGAQSAGQVGQLSLQADLSLSAPQVDVASGSSFTIHAPGQQVLVTGGSSTAAVPLSAGGSIAIDAREIDLTDPAGGRSYGVLRAPLGRIALNATDRIEIGGGSVVSVSGAGTSVLFGSTVNGSAWTYDNQPLGAPVAKAVSLNAATVDVSAGSTIDASGGGKLIATEFVAGPGGSTDVFAGAASGAYAIVPTIKGFAPQDADTLAERDASGATAIAQASRQITIGAGGPLPAGTYALLPARYALLDGAFLARPVAGGTPLALGAVQTRQDGSVWVGGQLGNVGAGSASNLPQTFQLMTSALARTYSQINVADANTYFAEQATAAGASPPRLPQDAGRLTLSAQQIGLKGTTSFAVPSAGNPLGGELDVSADRILVGTTGTAPAGTLGLNVADLNATGAATLVIGGTRSADGTRLSTGASALTLDNAGAPLKASDVILLANDRLELRPGAAVVAAGTTQVADGLLSLSGDGALLRVSADPLARTARTGAQRLTGELRIDAGAGLEGASVTAEATHATAIAADATFKASDVTLGANRIAVGDPTGVQLSPTTLALTPGLVSQLGSGQKLTLRSFDGIDFHGVATLGGSALQTLTLDTGVLRMAGTGAQARVEAGGVALVNTSGAASEDAAGTGTLQVVASGAAGGSGQITVGPGSVAVAGAAATAFSATGEAVIADSAEFATAGDLSVRASALQSAQAATGSIVVGGVFALAGNGAAATAAAGTGAHVTIAASAIDNAGRIVLPSGSLVLSAASGDIHLASGAAIDLSGRDKPFDGVVVSTSGGDLRASAPSGSIRIDTGAQVDVSAGAVGGSAGGVDLAAASGAVVIGGGLRGISAAGQSGATLAIDSALPVDLDALQATLVASAGNFRQAISVRNRNGDQRLGAGPGLRSGNVTLASDAGSLAVDGSVSAQGVSGATVVLAAGDTLTIGPGAAVSAHSTGPAAGQVQLMAGNVQQAADGSLTPNGRVLLDGGVLDTAAGAGGATGSVLVRAQRSDDGADVRVAKAAGAAGTAVTNATGIELEAVRQYATDMLDGAFIDQVNADNLAFAGTAGANAASIRKRVGGLLGAGPAVQLRAGIEVDQIDRGSDLVMSGDDASRGWNLTRFSSAGKALAQPTGAPVDLTLRSAGNLDILASLSDGFMPSGSVPTTVRSASVITPAAVVAQVDGAFLDGGRIRLVGGADLQAANVMATRPADDTGDVTIGNGTDVVVRSTTGAIQIAAGRDVTLTDHQAVVYTTGRPTTGDGYAGLRAQAQSLLGSGGVAQSPTLTGGSSVSVVAQRDVSGAGAVDFDGQYASEWLWRGLDASANGQATWWVRYDRFQQGFATFGGGNTTVAAGRDALNVEASTASNGYVARDATGAPSGVRRQGGGDLLLAAGRDISGGFVLEDGGALSVRSGRDIVSSSDAPSALQVLHGASRVDVEARDDATVGAVTAFGLLTGAPQASRFAEASTLVGAAPGATLRLVAGAGDLNYQAVTTTDNASTAAANSHAGPTGADKIVPDDAVFAAPTGSVSLGPLAQVSGAGTHLSVLAQQDATLSTLTVAGTDARQSTPTLLVDSLAAGAFAGDPFGIGLTPLDSGNRTPVRIVALNGDIALTDAVNIVKPIRVLAGRDVTVAQAVTLQQEADAEMSWVQAGRDVVFTGFSLDGASLKVQGPGDAVVLAGRDIELNRSGGVGATGNRENAALPARSATVTVLAGVSLGQGDFVNAASGYVPVLGATGIAAYGPDLAAQLAALQVGTALPAPGSAAAASFRSASVADQVTQTEALVGQVAFDAAVLADAQRRALGATVDLVAARTAFAALADPDKSKVVGAALATAWAASVPKAQQRQTVAALVAARGPADTGTATLAAFVAAQTGQAGLGVADALAAFDGLPPERQLLLTSQVLFDDIRNAGRAASALTGAERDAAYARAYDALAVVFPNAGGRGNLEMGSSQLRTFQDSAIDVLAPRGGVNVGALASATTPKSASVTGIVTGAGGDIRIAVRDDVDVNQSRVFTVGRGDLLIWSSNGNIDAGRGAKTVTGAPPPVFRFDASGNFVLDTSGSYSGSGIAVLNAASTLDLYAPVGEINAGDAGIKSLGNAYLGAARFVGADNLSVAGVAVGAPPPASAGGDTAGLAAVSQASTTAGTRVNPDDSEEEKERKRRKRLNLILDFLGFGDAAARP